MNHLGYKQDVETIYDIIEFLIEY